MTTNANIQLAADGNGLQVSGELSFATVVYLRDLSAALLKKCSDPVFDLQAVKYCDSAALALLTAWARQAKEMGREARFIHVPAQLMDIARLSNLQKVIKLEPEEH